MWTTQGYAASDIFPLGEKGSLDQGRISVESGTAGVSAADAVAVLGRSAGSDRLGAPLCTTAGRVSSESAEHERRYALSNAREPVQ